MNKELERLLELLKIEHQEDLEQYKLKIEKLPLHERKSKGFTWYPVNVGKQGYTIGDRAFVIVDRGNSEDEHQFRAGKTVRLFSELPAAKGYDKNGVIHYIDKNKMKIILNSKELPEWLSLGQVGVDLMFDETTYQEMEKALHKVMKATQGRISDLKRVILGKMDPYSLPRKEKVSIPKLNDSQNKAVNDILEAKDIAIVHGPPGTGKTTTLVQAIKLITKEEPTVLVAAPSNTAVDLLTERLANEGLVVVRIGNISRVDESILSHSLEVMVSKHPDSKNIKKLKKEAAESRRRANRYKRNFGRDQYLERQRLRQEANELMSWANQLEDRLIETILDHAQVITCTLVGSANKVLEKRKFQTLVIDEAAQALEPACWIPILKSSRVILTGDPFQLPPTVKSMDAQKKGFNITLLEKSMERLSHTSFLNTQYRMNEKIMGFSNLEFYNGDLKADDSVAKHRLDILDNDPLIFIDTAGCGFDEKVQETYLSRYNPDEFQILCEHLYQLVDAFEDKELPSIALISPYREQVRYMQEAVSEDEKLSSIPLTIKTIDGFQGQERDVVYISLVRSNGKGEVGFLNDHRRMNVAMTRARKQLIVVGDSATIGSSDFYQDFLTYCDSEGSYRTAWEYLRTT